MGVHGLWELLAPVGRRVSVETLAGKKLAIDASIWMIQFMKAMRDEKGEMVRNAHILGFFRRILKLLFLRTKPVFVFDGGTPALKRRTVIARRRQRENAQAKVRKTAEKLLLNHLKAMRLKEMAAELEKQRQSNDVKGKKPIVEEPNVGQNSEEGNSKGSAAYNQEELDAMLAASLAAEEGEGFTGDASTSGVEFPRDEVFGDEDDDEDEEMILPEMHEKVDPAILASLPPSMQLDLLVQMRERLMAENRQKYQKVKKAPARFSELQIQAYLKTVAFRREIDGVQKSAAGRGIGGVQTSRIASEANREFIFSSSYTGDKQAFTSIGQERNDADQSQPPPDNSSVNSVHKVVSETRSETAAGPSARSETAAGPSTSSGYSAGQTVADAGQTFHEDVETYLDEQGRVRVSRLRALGIRMTRDLQRNLDLMKEIEQEKADINEKDGETFKATNLVNPLGSSSDGIRHQEVTDKNEHRLSDEVEEIEEPAVINGTSIEVSFEDIGEHEMGNEDDAIFARLVAGDPVMDFSVDNSASEKQPLHSISDCEWEEGIIEDKINECLLGGATSDKGEVMWEEGSPDTQLKNSSYPDENRNSVSKGAQEEEAVLQEAIRRSLEDVMDHKSKNESSQSQEHEKVRETVELGIDFVSDQKRPELEATLMDIRQPSEPTCTTSILEPIDSKENSSAVPLEANLDESNVDQKLSKQDDAGEMLLTKEALHGEEILCMNEKRMDTCSGNGNVHTVDKDVGKSSGKVAHNSNSAARSSSTELRPNRLLDSYPADAQHVFHAACNDLSSEAEINVKISANNSISAADALSMEQMHADFPIEVEGSTQKPSLMDFDEKHEATEERLEEEMVFLDKEREELSEQQRKHERNAEAVTSEMFVECQELLQMFGLPYIIAPMEAEAQCAFMELCNLVDGVVTDDSDAFLFGARTVYKNIFDDRKYVETYLMKDIESELGLDREKLIHMALLLGSDYTEGVSGIGIVNAIEVVNAFPEKDGLREFREWIESPDPTILGKLDVKAGGNAKRKGSKVGENVISGSNNSLEGVSCDKNVPQSMDEAEKIKQIFMDKHRNVSKNWHIPSSFPSDAVISAYDSPQVDKSTDPFSWGKPDLFVLRKLCWEKFGWGASKADELLLPVLKEYNKHETQLRLEAFYTFNERFAKIRSKRIKKALKGISGDKSSELMDETMLQQSGRGKKRKANPTEDEINESGVATSGPDCADTSNQTSTTKEPKQLKGRKRKEKNSQINSEDATNVSSGHNARKASRIRGTHRGRGRRQIAGRGRREEKSCSEDSEASHDGGSCSEGDGEMQCDLSEPRQVRRSGRLRNTVNYTVGDEIDDREEMGDCIDEGTTTKDSFMDITVGSYGTDANEHDEHLLVELGDEVFADEKEQPYEVNQMSASQIDGNQIRDPVRQSQSSKDYLQSGGGFCLEDDEDEQTEFDGHASSLTREADPGNSSFSVEEANRETDLSNIGPRSSNETKDLSYTEPIMNDKAQNDRFSGDHTDDEPGNPYSRSLRAMPELRRKKKRT